MKFLLSLLLTLQTAMPSYAVSKKVEASKLEGSFVHRNYVKNGSFDESVTKNTTPTFGNITGSGATQVGPSKESGGASGTSIDFGCTLDPNISFDTCYGSLVLPLEDLDKQHDDSSCVVEFYNKAVGFNVLRYVRYSLDGINFDQDISNSTSTWVNNKLYVPCGTSTSTRSLTFYGTEFGASGTGNMEIDEVYFGPVRDLVDYPIMSNWESSTSVTISGYGTVTGLSYYSRRVGDTLEVRGSFTSGTVAASEAQIGVVYKNSALTVDTTKVPVGSVIGKMGNSFASTTYFGQSILSPTANQTYVNAGNQSSTANETVAANGNTLSGSTQVSEFFFEVPIVGWSATQSVTRADCLQDGSCVNEFSATVSDTGVVSNENLNWINGNCAVTDTSLFTCTFNTSFFADAPNCSVTEYIAAGASNYGSRLESAPTSASAIVRTGFSNTGASYTKFAYPFQITCQRGDADYKPSMPAPQYIGSITSNALSTLRMESAFINCDGGSVVNSESSDWIGTVGNISAGTCSVPINSGVFSSAPICTISAQQTSFGAPSGNTPIMTFNGALTTTSAAMRCYSDTGAAGTSCDFYLICIGAR